MRTRRLGNSDMEITVVGFGAWAIGGGGWQYAWGPQDDNESVGAIQKALDLGINWIDTAAVYGTGHSEEVVARALKGRAKKPFVFTKCGLVWNEKREVSSRLKTESVRREMEDSLKRLQMDCVDLYQVHWPTPEVDIEEAWSTLVDLQREGKTRYIGVSNFSVEQMKRVQAIAPITSLQPPYSLLERRIEKEILAFTQQNNIGVIVYSPMKSGLLTGKMTRERIAAFAQDDWRRKSPDFQEPNLSRNLQLADLLGAIGREHGKSAGEVAIAWTLRHPAVTGAIVGARSANQVEGIVGAADINLTDEQVQRLEKFVEKS